MNGNTTNVILIKKCYQKGTLMKDAINIVFDLKNSLTLGNSVSSENLRYSILKMSCLKHLNMSIWSLLLAQRCCRIGLR